MIDPDPTPITPYSGTEKGSVGSKLTTSRKPFTRGFSEITHMITSSDDYLIDI
jgi:hypothetical protein